MIANNATTLTQPDPADFDRLPPNSVEAEMCLIASLCLCDGDTEVFADVANGIRPSSFYQTDNEIIYRVIAEMHQRGQKIDFVLLRDELRRRSILEDVGGQAYLARILDTVPSWEHWDSYARVVREKSSLREIIAASSRAIREAYAPSREDRAAQIAAKQAEIMSNISVSGISETVVRLEDLMFRVVERRDDTKVRRIPTGLFDLDLAIGGIAKGRMSLVGGRPGMGKSAFMKQMVLNVASRGIPCGIVSIEESGEKIAENAISNLSSVENNKVAYGTMDDHEWAAALAGVAKGSKYPIFVDDVSLNLTQIKSSVTRLALKYKCELIVVDYLQLIDGETDDNENREITLISKGLKGLFKRLNVANLIGCQLNRGGESREVRKPTLKDLRGSGSLEQDGDLIILLHSNDYYGRSDPDYTPTHQLEAIIAKNKDNAPAAVPMRFDGAYQRIRDWLPTADGNNPFD